MSILRGRTWLMRGGAVVILATLVGAWALGLAEAGDKEKSPPPNVVKPIDPDDSRQYDVQRSGVVEKSDAPRTRQADPTQDAVIEPIVDTAEEPTLDGGDSDPTPTSPDPTPNSPDPDWDPDPSTPPPTNPPSEPEEECTDLVSVLNCVLDPITGQP